ncbi:hypothetical protein KDC22_27045 [Paenibacillus tritici]|uniref:hypothetical protein n=1 Tax=Paenibacillus tritici TaxID=1873425 RepID=UPI001BA68248|nr:hypothetical protein [Paenibacillus tritici]QUL53960.1 hypothetical protein KDC22_27045 [Paenibacillus tritici]
MSTWVDALRSEHCYNRCGFQILFISLIGKNPETKATAIASPRVVPFSPLFKLDAINLSSKNSKKKSPFWKDGKFIIHLKGAISFYFMDQLFFLIEIIYRAAYRLP